MPAKPLPPTDPWTEPYWTAARQGKLLIQRCKTCHHYVFYPRLVCPHCGADALAWVEATGKGVIYTYSVVTNNPPSAFMADLPFVIAVVQLAEGVRMMANIVDCDSAALHCDMPVEVTFEARSDEITLPQFRPQR
ncbi:MAG: Zn-ribbon domain-containing OB-fold protein [Chloroflexi bacterium]|nr:Zn-ribbon domain-containing OB-fold protein [Chloroflexota bacterium]